jgi:23S rRNA pseudouridine2604 synthase
MVSTPPEPVRLSKRVIELTRCSRSEADQYIEDGWVRVNGEVIEEPQYKVSDELVELDPAAKLTPTEPATMLLHKPAGHDAGPGPKPALDLVIAANRWAEDRSGIRTLKRHGVHLISVLPLEAEASGLLVFTQDGRVVRRMTEDAAKIEQEYIVEISGKIIAGGLARLGSGMSFHGYRLPPAKVSWQNENHLRFALKEVQPKQIRDMCAQVGLVVKSMKRLRIGRIGLAKMPVGQWRYLPVLDRF